jgi:hypothetical protein
VQAAFALAPSFMIIRKSSAMAARSARAVETQKKKARRAIPRAKVSRIQGNTSAVRKRLKKMSGKVRGAKAS